jgi:hypothetical protein
VSDWDDRVARVRAMYGTPLVRGDEPTHRYCPLRTEGERWQPHNRYTLAHWRHNRERELRRERVVMTALVFVLGLCAGICGVALFR